MPGPPADPIGPFPGGADPVEYDKLRRRVLWTMPSGLYVVGSRAGDRRNLMTLNWATQVSFAPKSIAISVEHGAVTHQLITESQAYALSIIDREDRAIVRKFVKPVAADAEAMTLNGFAYIERTTGAPILAQSVAWLDYQVRQTCEVGGHSVFIGEVVDAGFLKDEATPVLRMEDTRMNYGG